MSLNGCLSVVLFVSVYMVLPNIHNSHSHLYRASSVANQTATREGILISNSHGISSDYGERLDPNPKTGNGLAYHLPSKLHYKTFTGQGRRRRSGSLQGELRRDCLTNLIESNRTLMLMECASFMNLFLTLLVSFQFGRRTSFLDATKLIQ
jgi:hypothetical protein